MEFPGEVTNEVLALSSGGINHELIESYFYNLTDMKTAEKACYEIKSLLGEDSRGMKILTVYLAAALHTRELYEKKGIPDKTYIDTLKCLARFTKESLLKKGFYAFDREKWAYRQLALNLFRLGVLEYEMHGDWKLKGGLIGNVLSVHIPSDAVMTREALEDSYARAKSFFAEYYKDFEYAGIYCRTWLLAPSLREMLPKSSKILNFQADYEILEEDPENESCMFWVFHKEYKNYDELPEETGLQRAIKARLQAGRKVGDGHGRYKG